ncbi:hypothetical protein D3C76_1010360 [compost metagenome]
MGKLAAFHFGRKTSVAAEQVIHGDKHQAWREDEQTRAAQGFQMDQVEVRRYRQVTGELMIRLNADRADGDIRATTQQVKQPHTELTGKTFVDDLQRLQALAHHATLGIRVIGANIRFAAQSRLRIIVLVAVAIKQRIDFRLRKNTIAHVSTAG